MQYIPVNIGEVARAGDQTRGVGLSWVLGRSLAPQLLLC